MKDTYMSDSTISLLLFIGIVLFLIAGIMYAIRSKNTQRSGSYASMVAFHDMQTNEKQSALEVIIEKHAQKKWKEEESGDEYFTKMNHTPEPMGNKLKTDNS
jgi:hypothetical protein